MLFAHYRARVDELEVAKAITEAKKAINEFTKIGKRAIKEVELLMVVILSAIFEYRRNPAMFGTCWTKYDFAVTQTLKRVITLLSNKLHEDFRLNNRDRLENYIKRIKLAANFNDFVYNLPDEV